MIEPFLWMLMCVAAIAMCFSKVRTGALMSAWTFGTLGIVFAFSGWNAFEALKTAMDAYAANIEAPPFKVTLLVGGPLAYVLGKPSVMTLAGGLWIR